MDIQKITGAVDHTLLSVTATWEEIKEILDDGVKYGVASACIPPAYVARAKEYVGDALPICTVIGFPNGYTTTAVKVFEAKEAVENGADEIDMVINLGWVKEEKFDWVQEEIAQIKKVCGGKVLKVIVEACLLTEKEKIRLCQAVTGAGADYIKTSTGFSTGGATPQDVLLFMGHIGPQVKVKAAGGISSLADAENFLKIGASRLGTSRVVKLLKNETAEGY